MICQPIAPAPIPTPSNPHKRQAVEDPHRPRPSCTASTSAAVPSPDTFLHTIIPLFIHLLFSPGEWQLKTLNGKETPVEGKRGCPGCGETFLYDSVVGHFWKCTTGVLYNEGASDVHRFCWLALRVLYFAVEKRDTRVRSLDDDIGNDYGAGNVIGAPRIRLSNQSVSLSVAFTHVRSVLREALRTHTVPSYFLSIGFLPALGSKFHDQQSGKMFTFDLKYLVGSAQLGTKVRQLRQIQVWLMEEAMSIPEVAPPPASESGSDTSMSSSNGQSSQTSPTSTARTTPSLGSTSVLSASPTLSEQLHGIAAPTPATFAIIRANFILHDKLEALDAVLLVEQVWNELNANLLQPPPPPPPDDDDDDSDDDADDAPGDTNNKDGSDHVQDDSNGSGYGKGPDGKDDFNGTDFDLGGDDPFSEWMRTLAGEGPSDKASTSSDGRKEESVRMLESWRHSLRADHKLAPSTIVDWDVTDAAKSLVALSLADNVSEEFIGSPTGDLMVPLPKVPNFEISDSVRDRSSLCKTSDFSFKQPFSRDIPRLDVDSGSPLRDLIKQEEDLDTAYHLMVDPLQRIRAGYSESYDSSPVSSYDGSPSSRTYSSTSQVSSRVSSIFDSSPGSIYSSMTDDWRQPEEPIQPPVPWGSNNGRPRLGLLPRRRTNFNYDATLEFKKNEVERFFVHVSHPIPQLGDKESRLTELFFSDSKGVSSSPNPDEKQLFLLDEAGFSWEVADWQSSEARIVSIPPSEIGQSDPQPSNTLSPHPDYTFIYFPPHSMVISDSCVVGSKAWWRLQACEENHDSFPGPGHWTARYDADPTMRRVYRIISHFAECRHKRKQGDQYPLGKLARAVQMTTISS